jgi:thioredoxin reductase (NADPH)
VHRRAALSESLKYWVRPDIENRIKEGAIAARFNTCVVEIAPTSVVVDSAAGRETLPADHVLLLTGYCADLPFLARAGVRIDPQTSVPHYDPRTFETNVPGLFLAGAVVAGINSGQIFIENGRFHGAVVVGEIARRVRSAQTGVRP